MPEVKRVLHSVHMFLTGNIIRRNKGFTLLEILIATAIIGLLLSVITTVLIRGTEIYNRTKTRGDIQGNAVAALGLLSRELMETDIRSVYRTSNSTYPAIISFLSAVELNGTAVHYDIDNGKMEWQKYIIYYLTADAKSDIEGKVLIRREYDPTSSPPPSGYTYNYFNTRTLLYTDLLAQCSTDPATAGNRVMAREIKSLVIDMPYSSSYSSKRYVTLTLKIQKVGDDRDKPEEVEYTTSVYFRNSM